MYTVVVADDEEELRRAIVRRIDWERIGFRVAGEAENGVEALELVEREQPDLLLTDIKMPFVSGIDLARQVREIRPATQIAFLSGFDEFSYAQQAIQYNIISYMLKPISMEGLTQELTAIRQKIDRLFQDFRDIQQTRTDKSAFLMPLLMDGYQMEDAGDREEKLIEGAIECGILKNGNNAFRYAVMLTAIRDGGGRNCTVPAHVHSVDSILRKYVRYESFYWNGRVISLLIATPASFDKYLHILVGDIVQSAQRIMGLNCSIGISRVMDGLSKCHDAYVEASNALSYAGRTDSGVHYITDEEHVERIDTQEIANIVTEVETLIRGSRNGELEAYLEGLFGQMRKKGGPSKERTTYLMVQLFASVCKIVYAVADGDEIEKMQKNDLMQAILFQDGPFREVQDKLTQFCLNAQELIGRQRKKSSKVLCEKTLQIIGAEYGNADISLVSVSNEIGISPNYLSTLIKKETGKTFIDLLTGKRIEMARELVTCTSLKIREIAERCGYSDQHYFSYCFKKYSGVSPNVLRQQMKAGDR